MRTFHIKILVLVVSTVLGLSCSNDDNGGTDPPEEPMGNTMELEAIDLVTLGVDNSLVRIDDTLAWEPITGNNIQYQLFLGTTAQNLEEIAQTNNSSYPLETELELGTEYFWQVTASEGSEIVARSDVGQFKTEYIAPRLLVANAAFTPRRQATTVAFNSRLWHIGGADAENPSGFNEIWSSENGSDWVQESVSGLDSEPIRDYIVIEFNNRLWLSGQSQLYSSNDGINWVREADPPFVHFGSISMAVFNDLLWRFAGFNGTTTGEPTTEDNIYSSNNGTNWTLEAEPHGFFTESTISIVPLNGLLFAMEQPNIDDVRTTVIWTSSDGVTWQERSRSELGFFGFRRQMIAFQNSLYIVAGSNLNTYLRSEDGMIWEPATTREVNTQLFLKNFAELNNKLYAIGGGGVNAGEEGNTVWVFN